MDTAISPSAATATHSQMRDETRGSEPSNHDVIAHIKTIELGLRLHVEFTRMADNYFEARRQARSAIAPALAPVAFLAAATVQSLAAVAHSHDAFRATALAKKRPCASIPQLPHSDRGPSATPSHALAGNMRKLAEFVQLNCTSSISLANFGLQARVINSVYKGFDAVNNDLRQTGFRSGFWMGLTPDDSPLVLRDIGTEEIYSFDLSPH